MNSLEIDGEQYVSARDAAKEHGYVADYIGQLIRGGKLQGRKVGRAWYVSTASLESYFQVERTERTSRTDYISEPVIENKEKALEGEETIAVTRSESFESSKTADSSYELLNYMTDSEPALPQLSVDEALPEEVQVVVDETTSAEANDAASPEVTVGAPVLLKRESTYALAAPEELPILDKMPVGAFRSGTTLFLKGKLALVASFILAVLCLAAGASSLLTVKEIRYDGTSALSASASFESFSR